MSGIDRNPVSVEMTEASEWLVCLQEKDVGESDVAAWLRWCAARSENLEAFERVQALYDQLQALPAAERKAFLRLRSESNARATPELLMRWIAWVRQYARPLLAGASSAAVAVAFLLFAARDNSSRLESRDYRASRGTQQVLLLADHSHITLASASELQSNFTSGRRYLDLREGEAYFEVEHDAARPFVVRAGAMTVTATGTKFNVRTSGSRSVVAVTEGSVDVTTDDLQAHSRDPGSASGGTVTSPLHLRAGQQAARESHQPGLMVVDVNAIAATGWRQGRLEYVMEPLSSVVADVNRYTSRPVVIHDDAVGRMVFTGTVFVDRVNDWAMTLPAAFPVATTVAADGSLTLSLRADFR